VRLVRELLAADAEPAVTIADAGGRAARYLEVVADGLGITAAAILIREPAGQHLTCAASRLPAAANLLLEDRTGSGSALVRRASDERRAFLARRATDDPLVRVLAQGDTGVETVAILPLADRRPVGVLVLAGTEAKLAADVIRTLTPALRLLSLLVAPQREATAAPAPAVDPTAELRLEAMRAERDAQAQTILVLEAQVVELEKALIDEREHVARAAAPAADPVLARVEAVAAENSRVAAALATGGPLPEDATLAPLAVVDTVMDWSRYDLGEQRVVIMAPGTALEALRAEPPSRIVLNVAAPGGLAVAVSLRAHGVTAPMFGVVAQPGNERVVGLGLVEVVAHPLNADALVAAVERASPRGARVFATGRDADALMKVRQTLAKQGLSVSLARDTKQIDELLAMVRPQVVVIDLSLPMRQGYELVMRMAATSPIPSLVLIAPDGDPVPVMVEKLRERSAAGAGMNAKQWLAEISVQALPAKMATRPKPRAAVAP
jgi:DNA-binding response OmpR family regulator